MRDRLRDDKTSRPALTASLKPLLRVDLAPRSMDAAGVVEILVPGVSYSESSSEGVPVELSRSLPRPDAALLELKAGIATSFNTRRTAGVGRAIVTTSGPLSSPASEEFLTIVRDEVRRADELEVWRSRTALALG